MYVLVLLEARGGGKGLATLRAGVGSGTDVLRADVALEVAGVCEHLKNPQKYVSLVSGTNITWCKCNYLEMKLVEN